MYFELFLGRFYPLVGHLSIRFILLEAIFEVLNRHYKDKFYNVDIAISISIFHGGINLALSTLQRLYLWQPNCIQYGDDKLDEELLGVKIMFGVNERTCNAIINE